MTAIGDKGLLFGGETPTTKLGDTWQWDGTAWTRLSPAASPSARWGATMATLGTHAVLFGGVPGTFAVAETWVWDGATWALSTQPAPTRSPAAARP